MQVGWVVCSAAIASCLGPSSPRFQTRTGDDAKGEGESRCPVVCVERAAGGDPIYCYMPLGNTRRENALNFMTWLRCKAYGAREGI